jgi:hypothetical protein
MWGRWAVTQPSGSGARCLRRDFTTSGGVLLFGSRVASERTWATRSGSRQPLDDLDDVVSSVALESAVLDQVSNSMNDGALFGSSGHSDAPTPLKVQKTLVAQDMESPQHCVLVDPEDSGHVLGQGKALARAGLSVCNRSSNLRRNLVVQRSVLRSVYLDFQHGPSHSSAMWRYFQGRG